MPYTKTALLGAVDTVNPAVKTVAPKLHNATNGHVGEQSGLGLQSSAVLLATCTPRIGMSTSTDALKNPSARMATKELRRRTWRAN